MEIRVYVANLGKYNEGILKGEWFTLPHDLEDIFVQIGVGHYNRDGEYIHGVEQDGVFYEEYAIHDYEAPFNIEEYSSLDQLNEMAEQLENVEVPETSQYGFYDTSEVINFAHELENIGLINDATYHVGNIVTSEDIDGMVKAKIENGDGWERIKFFLSNADMNEEYHLIDGYENIVRLENDTLKSIVSDLLDEMKNNL